MSGPKAYTMREMKGIVEYLVEHKAYNEYRGRKMWMDFANSKQTTRTWQSLKETFLKRILPDIQNPYYHLTREQVCSFKQGVDVEAKERNRLEIHTVTKETSENENPEFIEQPSTSENRNEEDNNLGENVKSATITARNRSSADTFILDDEDSKITTEELLAELEEPTSSLRDCINFEHSEPSSVVREVLNDFETESEGSDKEPQMEIVEVLENDNTDDVNQEIIVVEDSENMDNVEYIEEERIIVEGGMEVDIGPTFDHEIITEVTSTELQGLNNWLEVRQEEQPAERNESGKADEETTSKTNGDPITEKAHIEPIVIEDSVNNVEKHKENPKTSLDNANNNQNSLSTTSDSIIPNNQEVLNEQLPKSQKSNAKFDILAPLKEAASRKRSTSQDTTSSKKKKLDNGVEKEIDDPAIEVTPSSNNTEAVFDALKQCDNPDSTFQDAQNMDESPQNKNPCLKSVSLFDEQFNTTKYSDYEEDTPIPNNKEKSTHISTAEDKSQEKMAKEVPPRGEKEELMNVDPPVENNHEKTVKNDLPVQTVQKTTPEIDPPVQKEHEKTAEIDPSADAKQGKAKTDLPAEKHDKTSKSDAPVNKKQDVILLKSNSDSDNVRLTPQKPKERFKHLARAFGFVPGTSVTAAQRRRSLRSRNRTKSQRNSCTLQEASDWEGSISEPELADGYISPPRGRRHRHARKYRKPQSGRIMSLDEDGGLFVVHGNKIIPLVKNGKALTFVTYDSLGCSEEEEELIWRQKYIDEKKKAIQLKRQLEEITEANVASPKSPVLQKPPRHSSSNKSVQNPTDIDMNKQMDIKQIGDSGKIQITLSKNNEETINLEGHWPQVLPIVQQVMSIFYKPEEAAVKVDKRQEDISGLVTPVLPIIDLAACNIDELEKEIFKEIEEQDKKEKTMNTNVTKRKPGRPKKTPSTSSEQSEKSEKFTRRPRKSKQTEQKLETTDENDKQNADVEEKNKMDAAPNGTHQVNNLDRISGGSSDKEPVKASPAKVNKRNVADTNETSVDTENKSVKTVAENIEPRVTRTSKKSGNDTDTSTRTITTRLSLKPRLDPEDDIRYMLPPEAKTRKAKTSNKSRSLETHEASQGKFRNSIDSTGYQDSDPSPPKTNATKRKRKVSVTVRKGKHIPRRKSLPLLTSIHDISLESSNSSYFIPKKSQSTLDSAVYKSESYEILMGNRRLSINKLDVIDENKSDDGRVEDSGNNSNIVVEVGSSSNVSLPLSPELSVVENLSISREIIRSDEHPTINEIQANDSVVSNIYNQYLISEIDVSRPLMQQDCELLTPAKSKVKKQRTPIKVSDLLSKVCTVNMSVNNTLSDTLDIKLRDLLLESAKKISDTNKENLMEVDESLVEPKKARKRCSTPRKRSNTKNAKVVVCPVIDEHMESCSRGGRNSCPPVMTFTTVDENAINSSDVQLSKQKPKPRVKKDVIKVKIQRPNKTKEPETNNSQISVYTDSGINETASNSEAFQSDTVDLIHNHSETCLQANECIGDSIDFVESSKDSIISINSTTSLECELLKVMEDVELLSGEYRRNVKDTSGEKSSGDIYCTPTDTVYHSPIASNCSLITEDLSDEAPPKKWYLLSEDDTNTNIRPEQMTSNTRVSNYSSSLKNLFPITCAVPDLSTISELSKENEGSRKSFDTDGDTRSSDYQTLLQ